MSEIVNIKEHTSCYNYQQDESCKIELINLSKSQSRGWQTKCNKLVALIKGEICLITEVGEQLKIKQKKLFFIRTDQRIRIEAEDETQLVMFRIEGNRNLCECYTFEKLYNDVNCTISYKAVLPFNKYISAYMKVIVPLLEQGANCKSLHQMKLLELLYTLRLFYEKEDLAALLGPMLSSSTAFTDKLYLAVPTAKSVGDMAQATNLSISGFKDNFKKNFGELSPYRWLQQQYALRVHNKIKGSNLSFNQIMIEEGFSNASAFTRFCKLHLKDTPHNLRKKADKNK